MYLRKFSVMLGLVVAAPLASLSAMASDAFSASDVQMVNVSSSYPAGYTGKITATIDDRGTGLTSFHFTDSRNSVLNFTADQLRSGVVLVHALGRDILKISAPEFTSDGGGQMILTFLRGFFGNDRREVRFDFIRTGSMTDWLLQTDDSEGREPFDSIAIVIHKNLGIPSGVGDITLSSSQRIVRHYDPAKLPAGHFMLEGVEPFFGM